MPCRRGEEPRERERACERASEGRGGRGHVISRRCCFLLLMLMLLLCLFLFFLSRSLSLSCCFCFFTSEITACASTNIAIGIKCATSLKRKPRADFFFLFFFFFGELAHQPSQSKRKSSNPNFKKKLHTFKKLDARLQAFLF